MLDKPELKSLLLSHLRFNIVLLLILIRIIIQYPDKGTFSFAKVDILFSYLKSK